MRLPVRRQPKTRELASFADAEGEAKMGSKVRAGSVKLKRAYEPPAASDGRRILIDRLWPRGVSKAKAAIDGWIKEIAPSTALRKWFGHDPARWEEFRRRYATEVGAHAALLEQVRALARKGPVTLVYAARDEAHNDAVALREMVLRGNAARGRGTPGAARREASRIDVKRRGST
jgi:uncharacterized protein YeaO (DUF488 family)